MGWQPSNMWFACFFFWGGGHFASQYRQQCETIPLFKFALLYANMLGADCDSLQMLNVRIFNLWVLIKKVLKFKLKSMWGNFGYFHSIPKAHIVFTCKTIFNMHGRPLFNNSWMPCLLAAVWLVENVCSTPKLVKNINLWLILFSGIFSTLKVSSLSSHT